MSASDVSSTRPYLIRALYEWCTDNGFTPYVAVMVDDSVQVPREYVRNGEIVLNISFDATSSLKLGNEFIEFKARFAGIARDIMVPVERVIAIYARENGQGMAFPVASAPTHAGPQMVGLGAVGMPQSGPVAGASVTDGETSGGATEAPEPREQRPVHLVPPSGNAASTESQTPVDEPPKPSGGSRPSLKRIK
jgi:stringent starvation protein B